jgi:hypothetical protein
VPGASPSGDGERLYKWLFADRGLTVAWERAKGQSPRRRIRLRIDREAAELDVLPWERLQEGQGVLAAHDDTPFSRYLPVGLPWEGHDQLVDDGSLPVLCSVALVRGIEHSA